MKSHHTLQITNNAPKTLNEALVLLNSLTLDLANAKEDLMREKQRSCVELEKAREVTKVFLYRHSADINEAIANRTAVDVPIQHPRAVLHALEKDVAAFIKTLERTYEPHNPHAAATKLVVDALAKHVAGHTTGGHDWPAAATHALLYNVSTWPMGWCKESCIDFFTDIEDLRKKIEELNEWSKCEDNYIAYQAYEWDLGPIAFESGYDTAHVYPTIKERDALSAQRIANAKRDT